MNVGRLDSAHDTTQCHPHLLCFSSGIGLCIHNEEPSELCIQVTGSTPGQAHRSMRGDRSLLSNAYLTFSLHLGLRPWRAIPQAHQAHSNPLGLLLCPESNTRATQSFSHSPGDAPIHIFNNSFETIHIPYDSLTWCHSKFFSTFGVVQQSPQSNLELFN